MAEQFGVRRGGAGGGKWGGGAQLGSPRAAGLVVDVVPGDDVGSPCGHGRANSEGETLVKSLPEQGQHLVSLRAVREVGHPCGARVPDSWIGVFSLRGRGGLTGLDTKTGSVWPAFCPCIPNRQPSRERMALGPGQQEPVS